MTTSKKKTPAKKAVAKKAAPKKLDDKAASKLTDASRIFRVADSGDPKLPHRRAARDAVPVAGITAAELCDKVPCRLTTVAALIRRGFVEIRA